jgi:hypothetical protein
MCCAVCPMSWVTRAKSSAEKLLVRGRFEVTYALSVVLSALLTTDCDARFHLHCIRPCVALARYNRRSSRDRGLQS